MDVDPRDRYDMTQTPKHRFLKSRAWLLQGHDY